VGSSLSGSRMRMSSFWIWHNIPLSAVSKSNDKFKISFYEK
jgi:hypothetical protein